MHGRRRIARWGLALLTASAAALPGAAQAQSTILVSRASGGGPGADAVATEPAVSADGRWVVFESTAGNLGFPQADPDNPIQRIYLHDRQTGATVLVSRATGAAGAPADADAAAPTISGDGRYVAFASGASNLSTADADPAGDVFVRDTKTDATILVSRASGTSGAAADAGSGSPAISADGRHVAFSSYATNLVAPALPQHSTQYYLRDLDTGVNVLVSRADGAGGALGDDNDPFGGARTMAVSADGSRVAFMSWADNLSAADEDSTQDIFVRDVAAGTTTLVSRAGTDGPGGNGNSDTPSISDDGKLVAFASGATNLVAGVEDGEVYVRGDGGPTRLVSRAPGADGAPADGGAESPSLSGDGRFVAFSSSSSNLLPQEDLNFQSHIYRRELAADALDLVDRADDGRPADAASRAPWLSRDGRYAAFTSEASNLAAGTKADSSAYERDTLAPAPVPEDAPAVSGRARAGAPATCLTGHWTGATTFAYAWLLDGAAIEGATTPDYVPPAEAAGHQLACRVTATAGGQASERTSAPVTLAAPATAGGLTFDYLRQWGSQGTGGAQFSQIDRIAIAPDGDVLVLNGTFDDNSVKMFRPDGSYQGSFGSYGLDPGQFVYARSLAVAPDGTLWIVDGDHASHFTQDGTYLGRFAGDAGHTVEGAQDATVGRDGSLYVAQTAYNGDGTTRSFVSQWRPSGTYVREFYDASTDQPTAMSTGPDGDIWVATPSDVKRFGADGASKGSLPRPQTAGGSFFGIDVDAAGNIWTPDYDAVIARRPDGTELTRFGTGGSNNGQFSGVDAVAVGANGEIFTGERFNYRVQAFRAIETAVTGGGTGGTGGGGGTGGTGGDGGGGGPGPSVPPDQTGGGNVRNADVVAPAVTLRGAAAKADLRAARLPVALDCDEACAMTVSGTLSVVTRRERVTKTRGKAGKHRHARKRKHRRVTFDEIEFDLQPVDAAARPGAGASAVPTVAPGDRKRLAKALKRGWTALAQLTIHVADPAGNVADRDYDVRVRLHR